MIFLIDDKRVSYWNTGETAKHLQISESMVRKYLAANRFEGQVWKWGKHYIPEATVRAFVRPPRGNPQHWATPIECTCKRKRSDGKHSIRCTYGKISYYHKKQVEKKSGIPLTK